MNKLFATGLLSLGLVLSYAANATTEEQESIDACEQYVKVGKKNDESEYFLSCQFQNRSPAEWKCMHKKRFSDNWSYMDAVKSCFIDAPGLKAIEKQVNNLDSLKASKLCELAYDNFQEHNKSVGMTKSELCPANERTAPMWACMAAFAEQGNSFMYSAGQCFPRGKVSVQRRIH